MVDIGAGTENGDADIVIAHSDVVPGRSAWDCCGSLATAAGATGCDGDTHGDVAFVELVLQGLTFGDGEEEFLISHVALASSRTLIAFASSPTECRRPESEPLSYSGNMS